MEIITKPADVASVCSAWRRAGQSVALVPTMGYYHAGHAALMARGRALGDKLVVSLFVNPTQFGPEEDLASYPRDLERDAAIAQKLGADVLFAPAPEDMYAPEHATWVEAPDLARGLCGKSRPIHFRGVCTVVLKLFLLTGASIAIFGQKDWQQQAIIRRMVRDLNVPTEIVALPTVREADGLALSSRNVYLSTAERAQAPELYRGLGAARALAARGERRVGPLRDAVLAHWAARLPLGRLDYLTVVDPDSLTPVEQLDGAALMACALRLGKARLIDNILLNTQGEQNAQ